MRIKASKYILQLIILTISLAVISCANTEQLKNEPKEIFPSYQFLSIPVSDLRIGAQWLENGIGAIGNGLPPEKLLVQNSLANVGILSNEKAKAKIDTSFLNLFGINIDYINDGSVSINYESVEVVSVNDIKSMPITSGSKYLFRGLRVKSFTINTKDNNSLGIEASIRKNPNVLSVSAIPFSTQKNVSLKGDGLFIAYQLVSFTKKSSNQNNYTLSALVKDRSDYKINNDYLLRIEQANVRKCVLQAKTKRGFSDYSKPTLKERYKGWPWVVNGDIESFAWLTFEECSNNKYEISAIKTNATVAGERVKAEFNVPFDWGSQDKEEYLIDVHIAGNSLLIDRIRFSNLANRDVEKIFKTGSRTGYIELQGIITFYRDTYDINISQ